ncbi:MAG: hypothetical protein IJU79_05315 [Desulfovibrionaceae bacterium]|nr:hypothetical protein [Desulfovibrionaceae bacterium]
MDQTTLETSWTLWSRRRTIQMLIGNISAFCFLVAAVLLLDGLQTLVRGSHTTLQVLAGQMEGVSGPCPFQNPLPSDLRWEFTPQNPWLNFELEGFFAGYMLGNGMWRGQIKADPASSSGTYRLRVTFKGASQAPQDFSIELYASFADFCAASKSFSLQYLGIRPFMAASLCAGIAFILGCITYILGRKNLSLLLRMGYAEIFRTSAPHAAEKLVWCSAKGCDQIRLGTTRPVYDSKGSFLGEVILHNRVKNVLCFKVPKDAEIPCGALICLKD